MSLNQQSCWLKQLAAQSTAYALRNWQGKHAFVKENEKNIYVKEI